MIDIVLLVLLFGYAQNIVFTMTSRARNRDNWMYHAACAIGSNGIWFATFRLLVREDMAWWLAIPYIVATVAGSLTGSTVSIWIEKKIGAKT